jgi:hypothetical protein
MEYKCMYDMPGACWLALLNPERWWSSPKIPVEIFQTWLRIRTHFNRSSVSMDEFQKKNAYMSGVQYRTQIHAQATARAQAVLCSHNSLSAFFLSPACDASRLDASTLAKRTRHRYRYRSAPHGPVGGLLCEISGDRRRSIHHHADTET